MGPNDRVQRIIRAVREHAATCEVNVPAIKLRWNCPVAEQAHAKNKRFLAHSFHAKNVICLMPAVARLPLHKLAGIIVHELGHILSGVRTDVAEPAADEWVRMNLHLLVLYDAKDTLEYLDDDSLLRLKLSR